MKYYKVTFKTFAGANAPCSNPMILQAESKEDAMKRGLAQMKYTRGSVNNLDMFSTVENSVLDAVEVE